MKVIVGLGNPGSDYENTRHNTGYIFCDTLKKINSSPDLVVKKTDTFMNESGAFVKKIVGKYKCALSDLYVVHDDLDIKLGEFKIQFGRGPKDHNGLKSVDESLRTNEYWHIRIGVDNRPLDNRPMGEEYVLENFTDDEAVVLRRVIKEIIGKLKEL